MSAQRTSIIPSSAFKSCHECDKPFNLFRFKYRCSKCMFCYCKEHLKTITRDSKTAKICELCLENLAIFQVSHKDAFHEISESDSGHDEVSELSSIFDSGRKSMDIDIDSTSRLRNLLQELQSDMFNFFENQIQSFIANICEELCFQEGLNQNWVSLIAGVVDEVCKTICPSVAFQGDKMNINEYVKIVKVVDSEESIRFFKAAVLSKKFAYKMIEKEVNQCKILLIKGSTWFYLDHKRILSITDIINQEKKYIKNLLDIIAELQPNIVILEKTMPQKLIRKLNRLGIGVQMNVSLKRLQLISRICQGKILSSLLQSDNLKKHLGVCKKFFQLRINSRMFSIFSDEKNSVHTGSIILTAPNKTTLTSIRKVLSSLLLIYRNVLIERNFFWQCNLTSKSNLFQSVNESFLKCKFASVSHGALCQAPKSLNIKYYSEDDLALGKHLISGYLSINDTCELCNKYELRDHVFYYIKGSRVVKFYMELDDESNNLDIIMTSDCNECCKTIGASVYLSSSAWEYSFHKFIGNFFLKADIQYNSFECPHDALKSRKFIFTSQGIRACIEYQEGSKFVLQSTNLEFPQTIMESILRSRFTQLVDSIARLIDRLNFNIKSLESKTSKLKSSEKSSKILSDLDYFTRGLNDLSEESKNLIFSPLETFFTLEAYKRYYFERFCTIKIALEGIYNNILGISQNQEPVEYKVFNIKTLSMDLIEFHFVDEEGIFECKEYLSLASGHVGLFKQLYHKTISVYQSDLFSMISYSLSSLEYYEIVADPLKNISDIEENLESELFSGEEFHFKYKDSLYESSDYQNHTFKSEVSKALGTYYKFSIKSYYTKHFHCLITAICGDFQKFIQSICRSQPSSTKNIKISQDGRFLIKIVSEDTFNRFLSIAPNYFRHETKVIFHNMPSKLLRILGAFKVRIGLTQKKKEKYVLLQENLASSWSDLLKTYEFKSFGSKKAQNSIIDSDFYKDFHGLPICVNSDSKKILDAAVWNDTLFLSKQNILNYVLVVKANLEDASVFVGIVDYFDQYTFEKAIQSKYKTALGSEGNNPVSYKENFRSQIFQSCFMACDD